jgi:DNA-binding MarR family transcriptional regulator
MARRKGREAAKRAASDDNLASLDDSTGFVVRRAYRAFTRALEVRLAEHDVNISMWFFLRLLWLDNGKSQKALSEELGLSQPTTVSAIDNLEKRGFVERRRDSADRRQSNVYLTAAGRALEARLAPFAKEVNDVAQAALAAHDQRIVRDLLTAMVAALDADSVSRAKARARSALAD